MNKAKEHLSFQVQKDIVYLYKNFLSLIQDIKEEHEKMLKGLKQAAPNLEQLLKIVDYMDASRQSYYRKKILDWGNESIRALLRSLEQFEVDYQK